MTQEQSLAEEIADRLGETEAHSRRQIALIVKLCGEDFARDILAQTLEVRALGGMLTSDGSHPRTIGGVFFYLARDQMNPDVRKEFFTNNRKRKKRSAAYKQKQAAMAAVMPPDVFQEYEQLKAFVSEQQSKLDWVRRQGHADNLEADQQVLADAQRQLAAVEAEYMSILHAADKGRQS